MPIRGKLLRSPRRGIYCSLGGCLGSSGWNDGREHTDPAIEKLLDYTVSGIGSVAGSMLGPWKAGREAKAKQITAKGEVETQRILAEGHSGALQVIAEAQSNARAILISPGSTVYGELDIAHTVSQRIQFQEEKRQRNIEMVVRLAASELGDKEVPDSETDHDWTARFFGDVQDVSSEEMQSLWAKVLAGEVERPGSMSIKTLSVLRNLDQTTASLFRRLCSGCVLLRPGGHSMDARVPALGDPGANSLREYGLDFLQLSLLNEYGLIIPDYKSWRDYRVCIGIPGGPEGFIRIPFDFQGRSWVLVPTAQREANLEFRLEGVALTRSGQELSTIVDLEPMDQFTQAVMKFFGTKNLRMTELTSGEPHTVVE